MKYFGYGANRTREMMAAITGKSKDQLKGTPVVLKGFDIGVQRFDQTPSELRQGSQLPIPVREIIRGSWKNPDAVGFYVTRPGEGEVHGTMWELTARDRDLVRNLELVGDWYEEQYVTVVDENGMEIEVQTEILGPGQELDHLVDGKDYPPFLNESKEIELIAEGARVQYLDRNDLVQEGSPPQDISRI